MWIATAKVVALSSLLLTPQRSMAINRDAYEFLELEDLEEKDEAFPAEDLPEELEGDLDIQENSYHLNRLNPYRPPSDYRPTPVTPELQAAQEEESNFFGDVDALQEQYSELRGRIPPRAPIKYPNHWKRRTRDETLADGFHPVRIKAGTIVYDLKNQLKFTLESKKFAHASRSHDSDEMVYLADTKGEFQFKAHFTQVEDLSPITEHLPSPKKFEMYDSPHSKDFYDRRTTLFTGLHLGALGESSPYFKDAAGGPVPYAQGYTVEGTGFLPWRIPFYPGIRLSYNFLNFQNTGEQSYRGHIVSLGPEIRYRWVGEKANGDGANLLLHLHRSFYSKIQNSGMVEGEENNEKIHYQRIGWKIGLEIQNENSWGHSLIGFKGGQDFVNVESSTGARLLSAENQFAWNFSITYGQEFEFDLL